MDSSSNGTTNGGRSNGSMAKLDGRLEQCQLRWWLNGNGNGLMSNGQLNRRV
jgi:hypothetical protein